DGIRDFHVTGVQTCALPICFIATQARKKNLLPLERGAVEKVMERMTRLTSDKERLLSHSRALNDLICEADHWATARGGATITAADVETAIAAHIRRSDRMRERTQEQFRRGTMILDTSGERI